MVEFSCCINCIWAVCGCAAVAISESYVACIKGLSSLHTYGLMLLACLAGNNIGLRHCVVLRLLIKEQLILSSITYVCGVQWHAVSLLVRKKHQTGCRQHTLEVSIDSNLGSEDVQLHINNLVVWYLVVLPVLFKNALYPQTQLYRSSHIAEFAQNNIRTFLLLF